MNHRRFHKPGGGGRTSLSKLTDYTEGRDLMGFVEV